MRRCMKRLHRSVLTFSQMIAAVVVASAAHADVTLQISASASDMQMQGKPFQISVVLPKTTFPNPASLPNLKRIPMPDTQLLLGMSNTKEGTLEVRGLPDAPSMLRHLG